LTIYSSRQCFEQNCLCANRWRIRPNPLLHTSQRGFGFATLEFASWYIRRALPAACAEAIDSCVGSNSSTAKTTAFFLVNLTCSVSAARRRSQGTLRLVSNRVRSWEWESLPRREPKPARWAQGASPHPKISEWRFVFLIKSSEIVSSIAST